LRESNSIGSHARCTVLLPERAELKHRQEAIGQGVIKSGRSTLEATLTDKVMQRRLLHTKSAFRLPFGLAITLTRIHKPDRALTTWAAWHLMLGCCLCPCIRKTGIVLPILDLFTALFVS
jgi:hypothetical protein